MKRLLLSFFALLASFTAQSQAVQVWCENFDGGTISTTSTGTPGWNLDPNGYFTSGPNSFRAEYQAGGGQVTLTSPVFSTVGNNFVVLDFKQICKIEFADKGELEYSIDNGVNWTKFDATGGSGNVIYNGVGNFTLNNNSFTEVSHNIWAPGQTTAPTNAWWQTESFDISAATANQATVQIRFKITDLANNGLLGRYGWLLDDICVTAAPCELNPPTAFAPAPGFGLYSGYVYNLGPYDVFVTLSDVNGIADPILGQGFAWLYWTVNGGNVDSSLMFNLFDSIFAGTLPLATEDDTICWWFSGYDDSGCFNYVRYPAGNGEICFIAKDGINYPFCDDFTTNEPYWVSDPTSVGSLWTFGPPTGPTLATAQSAPNVWGVGDIGGVGGYVNATASYLLTPILDFSAVTLANFSFWRNHSTEANWDGGRIDWTNDGGTTWNVLGIQNDPNGVNWYNKASINSSSLPAWDGSSNGWVESKLKLGSVVGIPGSLNVQFRFVFTSDASVTGAGFHIDDFCIKIPFDDDIGVTAITAPVPGSGQPAGGTTNVTVSIENFGTNTQSGFNVGWSINTVPQTPIPFVGSLAPGAISNLTIPNTPVSSGQYDVCVWTELATDQDLTNDTSCASYVGVPTIVPTPFYCDDFEAANIGWNNQLIGIGNVGTIWELGAPAFGSTTGANSGINAWDINLNSAYTGNANVALYTPYFDFSGINSARLTFAMNYNTGANADGTRIEYSTNNGVQWNLLGTGSTANPDACGTNWYTNANLFSSGTNGWEGNSIGWKNAAYRLCCTSGIFGNPTPVQFRFVFTSDGFGQLDGFSIDDFCITAAQGDDIGISAITSPNASAPSGTSTPVVVTLENFGITTITTAIIIYTVNGVNPQTITWNGSLAPCGVTTVVLPSFNLLPGINVICAWTSYPSDLDINNDTTCINVIGIPTFTPSPSYCDDFETGALGWTAELATGGNIGTNWELGLPNFGFTTGANSGAGAWDINLNNTYTINANSILNSPYFDFSAIGAGRLSFALNYNCEVLWDGTRIEYTTNNGSSWLLLGTGSSAMPDPCATNWYTDAQLNSSLTNGWAGNSNGWKSSTYKLCCTSGIFNNPIPIRFRFIFTSDASVILDGFSIDDFCVFAPIGDDVGITAITAPVGGVKIGATTPVVVTLENFGSTTITSTPITFTVNGGSPQTITWNGSLPPCGITTVVLPNATFIQGSNLLCAYTQLGTDVQLANDTTCVSIIGQPTITLTYVTTYEDEFDAGNIGWAPYVVGNANTKWELGIPLFGSTTGAYTVPNCWDVNLISAPGINANTYVTTPYFNFSNAQAAVLRFYQNRDIYAFGDKMYIEYTTNSGATWNLLTPTTQTVTNWYNNFDSWDDISGGWIQSEFKDVTSAIGGLLPEVQFRFVYTSNGFTNGDGVSVDNFEIFVPIPLSVKTETVNTSVPCQFIFPGQPITFAAPIKNNGVNTVFNHNISLVIDGILISNDPVTYTPGGLLPDSTRSHNFNNTWIAVPGFHDVCVYTDSPNGSLDLNQFDDTACVTVFVFDSISTAQLPFCTSFETGNKWVTSNAITYCSGGLWELGTPTKPNLSGAHTGNNAWTTNLTANYANKDSSGLFSSLFRVQANRCYKLSFWHEFRMEYGSDGGALDYSVDYGQTWNRIDMSGTPNIQLFGFSPNYTYVSELDPTDLSKKGFTGVRNNWIYNEKVFRPSVDAQIVLRWRFASDFSATDEGWSIDDVCFEDLGNCVPLGIDEFAINNFGLSQNYPNPSDQNTTFEMVIPEPGQVRIVLNDVIGQEIAIIKDQNMAAGKHTIQFNTAGIAAGLYTYTMVYDNQQIAKRMIITH